MRCRAVLRSGVQCGREAAAGAELCAYHGALEFRGQARAFYLARLSAEDLEGLADAARVQGVDGEIAVLRVLLRNVAHAGDLEVFRRGLESLCRLVQTKHDLDAQARDRLGTRLAAALEKLGADQGGAAGRTEAHGALTPTLSQREREPGALTPTLSQREREPAAAALAQELGDEAQAWWKWEALAERADPEGEQEPAQAREAAGLARRYQAGDGEALDLLYARLEVAILAVLLHHRDLQVPPAPRLDELQEWSRTALTEVARGWHPGVSFLGYFFRTFPDALALQARRAERAGRVDVERLGAAAVNRADLAATEALASGVGTAELRESRDRRPGPEARDRGLVAEGPEAPFWAADLASLPELERQVVVLRGLEGQPLKWVARQVGVPVGMATKLYERARGRLGPRSQGLDERGALAMRRLVRALHVAAGPDGRLPNRNWAMGAAGLKRGEYDQLMDRLEGAGAIYGRRKRQPGHLAERNAAGTLGRVGLGGPDGAVGTA